MSNLGRSLQPYAHFSPGLLQWNMNMVNAPDEHTGGVVAIGPSYDPLRAQRIQLLRGALLWTLVPRQATLALLMVAARLMTLRSRGSVAWLLRQMM